MDHIILFDGICNFCNASVQFIIKRDPNAHFKFATLQSDVANDILSTYISEPSTITADPNSFILISNGKIHTKSTASLHVMKHLSGVWPLLFIFIIIPKPIRDYFYTLFAKNRYRLFGKRDTCILPNPKDRKRFL